MSACQSSLFLDGSLKCSKARLCRADHEMVLIGVSGQVKILLAGGFDQRCKIDVRSNVYLSGSFEGVEGATMS